MSVQRVGIYREWRKAAGSDEVWAPLVTRYFPLHGYAAGGMRRFRELSEGMYLPVLHRADLYRVFFSGKVEVTSLRQPHNWWAGSLSLTIAVLPLYLSPSHLRPISPAPRLP